ncbi:MAG: Uma2 family endonuclease [Chloroflexota bacterium]
MTMHERRAAATARHDALVDRRLAPDYVPPPPAPVSWEAFLAWLDEDTRAEWVDGAIIEMSPASEDHQDDSLFLATLLLLHIQAHRLGRIFHAPFVMRLPNRPSGREPDLLFVRAEHTHRIRRSYVDGPADLVVEIVSPESVERDYREKLAEYEAAGIPEYWIIDPLQGAAHFYQLDGRGKYQAIQPDADGVYTSREVPGFRLRVSWLWQRPLPTIHEALADLPG